MPLASLGELIDYAVDQETKKQKKETEKQLFPLWLVSYGLSKFRGTDNVMDFETFMSQVEQKDKTTDYKTKSSEEIMAEFMPLITRDSNKRGG